MVLPVFFVLECLCNQLIKLGAKGLQGIIRTKKELGDDKCLDKGSFHNFLNFTELGINSEELALILNTYEQNGRFQFLEFLVGLRRQLNDFRQRLVVRAFRKLDQAEVGYISLDRIRRVFNAKCHPAVMAEKMSIYDAIENYIADSFGLLEQVTLHDFKEYYALIGSRINLCSEFELLMMKQWKVQADGFDVDDAENKVKLIVYKNRIRIREFFRGFDKLRLRLITDTQFAAGLDNANVKLSLRELKALMDEYRVPKDPEFRVCYTAFCDEIDTVFTCKELEKMPWKEVPPVPHIPGLAPERFHMGITYLGPEKEEMIKDLLDNLRKECKAKRISVKGFFEDAAHNKNSSKSVGHVTKQQFSQALSSKAGLKIRPDDLSLLVEKFDENYSGMVNYVAFSSEIDPFEEIQNIAP